MAFAIGSLVRARGREWVVLPESSERVLVVRPLGGTDDEQTGIYLPLEKVEPASFQLPDPRKAGDYRSGRLLRDAVRLGFRSSAGPFRSFAKLGVEPRPYQLVPLLMGLKLDPVRLLISDDVGIGKTVEAALLARELLERGEVRRLTVLCPPQLAEQWQSELRDKFHIEAELVLPGTATRLERDLAIGQSLFDIYPFTVVSTDFIKTDRRRQDFLRTCPELVIVDEAHTCAQGGEGRGRHQRHQLVAGLAADPNRHMILVTATPHSGDEGAFRSLIAFLGAEFRELPEDLTGRENEQYRRRLAAHFVQRRRADIRAYLDTQTPFPDREETEQSYKLTPEYKQLFDRVLVYARETVLEPGTSSHRQRVRWWSMLALLRSLASSPAAAAATLRTRAATAATATAEEADAIGRRTVFDQVEDEGAEGVDIIPGSDSEEEEGPGNLHKRRLLDMARAAEALLGTKDAKLQKATQLIGALVKDGFKPIVFCRYIPTAEYVAAALRSSLPKGVEVAAITGLLPPAEREARVAELGASAQHVLVATDCLSEGINLQQDFDAVFHYDLSWNPTRHEQREGRVDRFSQRSPKVRVVTYYGIDNQIDGVVLDILIRKHKTIRSSLGISVPVPADTDQVVEAVFEGLLLREKSGGTQMYLPGFDELLKPKTEKLFGEWEASAEREKRSRTMFAQQTIRVDEVARELEDAQSAIGSGVHVSAFVLEAVRSHGAVINGSGNATHIEVAGLPQALRDAMGIDDNTKRLKVRFDPPAGEGEIYLSRTHPMVEGLAGYVMDTALDALGDGIARRCGVIRTSGVSTRTTLLLLRFRYHIVSRDTPPLLAEDCRVVAFEGAPTSARWLEQAAAERLLGLAPEGNVPPDMAATTLTRIIGDYDTLQPKINEAAIARGQELLDAHRRVRAAARQRSADYRVETQLPPDVLGMYVYLPIAQ